MILWDLKVWLHHTKTYKKILKLMYFNMLWSVFDKNVSSRPGVGGWTFNHPVYFHIRKHTHTYTQTLHTVTPLQEIYFTFWRSNLNLRYHENNVKIWKLDWSNVKYLNYIVGKIAKSFKTILTDSSQKQG